MTAGDLREAIERLSDMPLEALKDYARDVFGEFLQGLEAGTIRAAEPEGSAPEIKEATRREPEGCGWRVNAWVKQGILLGFRLGRIVEMGRAGPLPFLDKDTYPPRKLTPADGVRLVPGGSAVRAGAHVAAGVVIMPPAYVNVGAYVDEGTMVDSHALVGSCAQVGRRVHLSAGAMLGGVLEPVGALPVIVEDEVLIGGNCGVYEGTIVGRRAVLGSGVILTGSVTVYDVPRRTTYRRTGQAPLRIPDGAVVVAGARRLADGFAETNGLSLYTPVIVKYRDDKTDAATALEEALR